jgi:hypothetical protein
VSQVARRISSNATIVYKRISPIFWFGFLATFLMMGIAVQPRVEENFRPFLCVPFLIIPRIIGIVGYFVFKALIFDLADEV